MNRTQVRAVPLALVLTAGIPVLALAGETSHGDHSTHGHGSEAEAVDKVEDPALTGDAAVTAEQLPTYPLSVCPASGEGLGTMGDPVNHVHEGRLVRFCCSMCEEQFNENPAVYLAKIDAAVVTQQLPAYPLGVCPVSGMELGSMGEPYNHVHGTRLVRFCCAGCLDTFNKDAGGYLAEIDAAAAATAK